MKELLCIVCPNGCRLEVEEVAGVQETLSPAKSYRVTGNRCKRGVEFAITELTNPTRSITTTVRTDFPGVPVLPVRSSTEIPKARIRELIQFLGEIRITELRGIGEIVVHWPLGLKTDIIATSNILKETRS
jgi:CxxC motif-containing protein